MTDNIELTQQELEDIKDDVKWRTSTSIYLKTLTKKLDDHVESSEGFRDDVKSLKTCRVIYGAFISAILLSLIAMPFWMAKFSTF